MFITVDGLRMLGAYESDVEWFAGKFPQGTSANVLFDALAEADRDCVRHTRYQFFRWLMRTLANRSAPHGGGVIIRDKYCGERLLLVGNVTIDGPLTVASTSSSPFSGRVEVLGNLRVTGSVTAQNLRVTGVFECTGDANVQVLRAGSANIGVRYKGVQAEVQGGFYCGSIDGHVLNVGSLHGAGDVVCKKSLQATQRVSVAGDLTVRGPCVCSGGTMSVCGRLTVSDGPLAVAKTVVCRSLSYSPEYPPVVGYLLTAKERVTALDAWEGCEYV